VLAIEKTALFSPQVEHNQNAEEALAKLIKLMLKHIPLFVAVLQRIFLTSNQGNQR
jgi:hypothetical protein